MSSIEQKRVYRKKWNDNNKEKKLEIQRKWRAGNKERCREYDRKYYWKNPEKRRTKRHTEYWADPEKARTIASKWAKENPKSRCANQARYMARKRNAEGSFTAEDIKDLYATQGARCYYCSVSIEELYHIEHMTPLSRGGKNDVSNICLACAPCNLSKHTKTAEEFQGAG